MGVDDIFNMQKSNLNFINFRSILILKNEIVRDNMINLAFQWRVIFFLIRVRL